MNPIYEWLLDNKQAVLDGNAEYRGTKISDTTIFRQFEYVVSPGIISVSFKTPHMISTQSNQHLSGTALKHSLVSLLCGWWCIPWGPLFTAKALWVNSTGGHHRTAASLLQQLEWGWDAPSNASVTEFKRDLVDLSPDAFAEIESRKAVGRFPDGIAVRITPTTFSDAEVEVAFDYPVSDGRFWIDESEGITLIIDKKHESELAECVIDYVGGSFVARMGRRRTC